MACRRVTSSSTPTSGASLVDIMQLELSSVRIATENTRMGMRVYALNKILNYNCLTTGKSHYQLFVSQLLYGVHNSHRVHSIHQTSPTPRE